MTAFMGRKASLLCIYLTHWSDLDVIFVYIYLQTEIWQFHTSPVVVFSECVWNEPQHFWKYPNIDCNFYCKSAKQSQWLCSSSMLCNNNPQHPFIFLLLFSVKTVNQNISRESKIINWKILKGTQMKKKKMKKSWMNTLEQSFWNVPNIKSSPKNW